MLGGVLLAGRYLWDYVGRGRTQLHVGYRASGAEDYLFFLVPLLLALALAGVYRRHAGAAGPRSRRGLAAAAVGCVLWALGDLGESWVYEGFTWGMLLLLGWLLLAAGLVLFGAGVLRARPGLGLALVGLGLLPVVNVVVVLLRGPAPADAGPNVVLMVLFGVAWVLLGYALWAGRGDRPAPPPAAGAPIPA
jgi:hypothetical protein